MFCQIEYGYCSNQMTEKLLQYIWQFQLFNKVNIQTIDLKELIIIHPGNSNSNQGPDFLTGKINYDNAIWFGNIELHVHSTEWRLHQHSKDDNYKNIILHVVWNHDEDLGLPFPTLELKLLVPKLLLDRYRSLLTQNLFIPCEQNISIVNPIVIEKWKERLLVERLQKKAVYIEDLLKNNNYNWEETFWWMLARGFGGDINGEAFEQIAKSIPFRIFLKHSNAPIQVEALLMGQGGLLKEDSQELFPNQLKHEYVFLKNKYLFKPPKISLLFLRMRPSNFPTIRLSQLASLICKKRNFFSEIVELNTVENAESYFDLEASEYWDNHYCFNQWSATLKKRLGRNSISHIIINTIVPMIYAYGYINHNQKYLLKSIRILEQMKSEKNKIVDGFLNVGVEVKSAFDSQSFIQLKKEYCNQKKCLECSIGHAIFKDAKK